GFALSCAFELASPMWILRELCGTPFSLNVNSIGPGEHGDVSFSKHPKERSFANTIAFTLTVPIALSTIPSFPNSILTPSALFHTICVQVLRLHPVLPCFC